MQNTPVNRFGLAGILLGLSLAAGLIISSSQVAKVWLHIADSQVIGVTGSARQDVASDNANWSADYSTEGETMAEAQQKLKSYTEKVNAFFKERNVTNAEMSAITIQRMKPQSSQSGYDDSNKRTIGYHLQQTIHLESVDIRRVMELQQQSVVLIEQGVELDDQGIQFIYTKTAEAKIEMLAAATKDARQRAE